MPIDPRIGEVLRHHLGLASSSFSIGAMGAIAEFHRDPDEPLDIADFEGFTIATERGALSVDLADDVMPIAYEAPSRNSDRWSQEVLFCRPREAARAHGRDVLTELGPDEEAIRPGDRGAVLFDLGLGTANVDFCVRTAEPALLDVLRDAAGRSVLAPGNTVMRGVIAASPHRVALSALGRLEVYQAIGTGTTPSGPHTHVLPNLLADGMTHSAAAPVPETLLPCLNLYPAHPVVDGQGRVKPFDPDAVDAFARLLELWGDPEYRREKRRAIDAIARGDDPDKFDPLSSATSCQAMKIAIRQCRYRDGDSDRLRAWSARFDADADGRRVASA